MWILNEGMLARSTMALKYEKISWIAISVTVLFVTIYFFDGEENSDIGVFLVWSMLALSFPVGIACALIFSGITYLLYQAAEATVITSYWTLSLFWAVLFIAGYWQWFVLTPRLVAKFRKK